MNWYYRVLLSYTPVFFVVISVLIFSFFAELNISMKKQLEMTDRAIATKVMQVVDSNLKAAELIVIKEMYSNDMLKSFFNDSDSKEPYDYFMISQKLDNFSSILPFSNLIYLYNEQTGKVLSRSGIFTLDQFGDSDFLLAEPPVKDHYAWTSPRVFREFAHGSSEETVISLMKAFPYSSKSPGFIVVNVRVSSLNGFIKDLTNYDNGLVQLFSPNLEAFDKSYDHSAPLAQARAGIPVKSDYTGWQYYPGETSGKRLSLLTFLSNTWMVIGFISIVIGLIGFTYITHRNYKPIRSIAGRIQEYTKRKSGELTRHTSLDEIKFIDAAIEGLLERTMQYEQSHKDDLIVRRRQLLFEWLEGHKSMSELEWSREMEKLQMNVPFVCLGAAVLEIDHFPRFSESYNYRDQCLFKFVVSNVLQEIAQQEDIFIWNEWLEPQQMAVVLYFNQDTLMNENAAVSLMKRLQEWVCSNLEFTVSVGIGSDSSLISEVPGSYKEAKECLSYKPVFGVGSLITKDDVHFDAHFKEKGRVYPHLQMIRTIAKSFRLDDGHWPAHLSQLHDTLTKGLLSHEDLRNITHCLVYHLNREMQEMNEDVGSIWKAEYARMGGIAHRLETLEEWYDQLCMLLSGLEPLIRNARTMKTQHTVMIQVKDYIETNYADPDLSLIGISEQFSMNSRYLSKLFKEHFGEKFIDYVIQVRLEKARRLLVETDLPVQSIAEMVGYIHVISFHRAFKKMFGLPPGDYRKRADSR